MFDQDRHQSDRSTFEIRDVKPQTPVISFADTMRLAEENSDVRFTASEIAPTLGMSTSFIRRVLGKRGEISASEIIDLLQQDAFSETFVPRSRVLLYLLESKKCSTIRESRSGIHVGDALNLIRSQAVGSVQAVVTSTPYWAMRIYDDMIPTRWADGEFCPFGFEQTPEGFIRHSVEILHAIKPLMTESGSVWWNLGDTYSTRTQIRGNASEALRAMQGKETKRWHDHAARRYSAGHSYLKDGEQCLIPSRIAERASRIGYYTKSMISWVKTSSMPEPQQSRVSRNVESVIHLTLQRTPKFHRNAYENLPILLGGRTSWETGKLSDSWILPTSSGRGGHGAQFPLALPGRCIGISSDPGDLILDPFMGSGTTAVAAQMLDRKWLGFEISSKYAALAAKRIDSISTNQLGLFEEGVEGDYSPVLSQPIP